MREGKCSKKDKIPENIETVLENVLDTVFTRREDGGCHYALLDTQRYLFVIEKIIVNVD